MYTLCKDGGPHTDCICRGDKQFVIEIDNLNFEKYDQLSPKFQLRGINFLLQMGLFADHDESSNKVIDEAKNLEALCK